MTPHNDFWPGSHFSLLQRDAGGWLVPTEAYVRTLLARPELALVPESCAAEIALHEELVAEAEADPKIVAVTAAMPDGTGLDLFADRFPKRCFDVGIAEQPGGHGKDQVCGVYLSAYGSGQF